MEDDGLGGKKKQARDLIGTCTMLDVGLLNLNLKISFLLHLHDGEPLPGTGSTLS
jgi:hypothetical protein